MATEIEHVPFEKLEPAKLSNLFDRVSEKAFSLFDDEEDMSQQEIRAIHRNGFLDNGLRYLGRPALGQISTPAAAAWKPNFEFKLTSFKPSPGPGQRWGSLADNWRQLPAEPGYGATSKADLLSQMVAIYARVGRFDDLPRILRAAQFQSDLPVVGGTVVRELVGAGRDADAAALAALWPDNDSFAVAQVHLTKRMEAGQAAERLAKLLAAPWRESLLLAVCEVVTLRSLASQKKIIGAVCRRARRRSRAESLTGLAALVPLLQRHLSPAELKGLVGTIFGMERWWSPA